MQTTHQKQIQKELLEALKSAFLYIETYGGQVTDSFFAGGNGDYYKALIAKVEGR